MRASRMSKRGASTERNRAVADGASRYFGLGLRTQQRHMCSPRHPLPGSSLLVPGESLVNRKNSGTQSKSRAWVGVLSIIGLIFAPPALRGKAQAGGNTIGFYVGVP